MTEYEVFIEKLNLLINNSNKLIFKKGFRPTTLTNEDTKKIFNKILEKLKYIDFDTLSKEDHKNIIKHLAYHYMPTDNMFRPYRSYDYSFLDIYNETVKNVMINQIELDSNGYCNKRPYDESLFDPIDNIDDLITLTEFYLHPPSQLRPMQEYKD